MSSANRLPIIFILLLCLSCNEQTSSENKGDTKTTNESNEYMDSKDSSSDKYPLPWRDASKDEFITIGRALIKNDIIGCGIYYVRKESSDNGSYLVACSEDGNRWLYYIVWVYTQNVMGPYVDNTIEKPVLR